MSGIKASELISLTAQYAGFSQDVVKEVLNSEAHVIIELLKSGHSVKLPVLGQALLTTTKARAPREFKKPNTGEIIMLEAKEAYQKPAFRFYPAIHKEIKELTEGNLL
jgi:nucleoid DNA-binding protein